jgi:PPM family protein phosphatase
MHWGASTHVGRVRAQNEDAILVRPPLFAVADGMGGHAAGEVASALAVEELTQLDDPASASPRSVVDAIQVANRTILATASAQGLADGMGTTLTALSLSEGAGIAIFNVGDSRAYRYRDGQLIQLSADHSLVAEMVRSGRIAAAEARTHPDRHVITRALGISVDVEVDCWELLARSGDRYLLCSDGLTGELSEDAVANILRSLDSPQVVAERLVSQAVEAGGRDNVSVVVVDIEDLNPGELDTDATNPRPDVADDDDTQPAGGVIGAQ